MQRLLKEDLILIKRCVEEIKQLLGLIRYSTYSNIYKAFLKAPDPSGALSLPKKPHSPPIGGEQA